MEKTLPSYAAAAAICMNTGEIIIIISAHFIDGPNTNCVGWHELGSCHFVPPQFYLGRLRTARNSLDLPDQKRRNSGSE